MSLTVPKEITFHLDLKCNVEQGYLYCKFFERFEIYIEGVELANCFNELCDLQIQKKRAERDLRIKMNLYNYSLPLPKTLFKSLEKGLPPSSGVALGVERLFSLITKEKNPFLDTDQVFPD